VRREEYRVFLPMRRGSTTREGGLLKQENLKTLQEERPWSKIPTGEMEGKKSRLRKKKGGRKPEKGKRNPNLLMSR